MYCVYKAETKSSVFRRIEDPGPPRGLCDWYQGYFDKVMAISPAESSELESAVVFCRPSLYLPASASSFPTRYFRGYYDDPARHQGQSCRRIEVAGSLTDVVSTIWLLGLFPSFATRNVALYVRLLADGRPSSCCRGLSHMAQPRHLDAISVAGIRLPCFFSLGDLRLLAMYTRP